MAASFGLLQAKTCSHLILTVTSRKFTKLQFYSKKLHFFEVSADAGISGWAQSGVLAHHREGGRFSGRNFWRNFDLGKKDARHLKVIFRAQLRRLGKWSQVFWDFSRGLHRKFGAFGPGDVGNFRKFWPIFKNRIKIGTEMTKRGKMTGNDRLKQRDAQNEDILSVSVFYKKVHFLSKMGKFAF